MLKVIFVLLKRECNKQQTFLYLTNNSFIFRIKLRYYRKLNTQTLRKIYFLSLENKKNTIIISFVISSCNKIRFHTKVKRLFHFSRKVNWLSITFLLNLFSISLA